MMPHYRGMTRGLCTVVDSVGLGVGNIAHAIRFTPRADAASAVRRWLLDEILPALPAKPGIGSVHLLEGAAAAPMTNEQRIRGADTGVASALLIMGYDEEAVSGVAREILSRQELEPRGASTVVDGLYRLDYILTRSEINA
jgi:hypothetical protein